MTKTKVCCKAIPSTLSIGIQRVASALERHAPDWVEIVDNPKEADLWIVHVIGHGSMEEAKDFGGAIAMVQYCLLTTEDSRPEAWLPYWQRSKAVWSYYDLQSYLQERRAPTLSNFYYAPLGVFGGSFKPEMPIRKRFLIGTSGYVADTEGVKECHAVARALDREMFHLGPDLKIGNGIVYVKGCPDDVLGALWSQCSWVAGLRRIEGFELPVLEGLASGSRPICFDAPHYRNWFGEHAEYVPEVGFDDLVGHLSHVMTRPVRQVTAAERTEVLRKFNWETLAKGFWEAVR